MALVANSAEGSLLCGKLEQFPGPSAQIDGYGSQTVKVKVVSLPLEIGWLLVWIYTVCIPDHRIYFADRYSIRPNVANVCVGILSLSVYGEDHCEGICEASLTVIASTLEGNSCETVLSTRWPEEISITIIELAKVGVVQPSNSPFNSPLWSFQKSAGSWRMMVDYRELNKIMPPLHASIPLICDLIDQFTTVLGTYHFVVDLANAFFSKAIADESQGQLVFTWEGKQWMFRVLPQGYMHSLTICHWLAVGDLEKWKHPISVNLFHYIDDMLLTSDSLEDLEQCASESIWNHMGWLRMPQKSKGLDCLSSSWEDKSDTGSGN